ncbi:ComEC/Rec2 family competence protein [Aurantimicrobium sp. MWH-Uga1]|uniref:ComEC/Rec2 family competence protein n=1 Tax=Aurantimicrobium sp. MWH-Uga1 TaxID=2079575 RepID=UPI000DEDA316|nr:ComEC/Rec2 family competence protein [Aurantimicrobium sp. MWH-Uga1]AXE54451.1 ComEC family competence protein [Aurantimicrobium sp. MWH-Uga1]
MNHSSRTVDLRLAIPVLASWILLSTALLLGQIFGNTLLWALIGCCVGLSAAIFGSRLHSLLFLSGWITTGLFLIYLIRLPTHRDLQPWETIVTQQQASPEWAVYLRQSFLQVTSELPGPGGELLPGLAIGDTSRLTESLDHAMKTVSLTHITAVSGANCAIVTAGVMMFAALCGAGRKLRLIAGITALVSFVIIVTAQPSVVRAAVMATIVMIALFLGRPAAGIPLLSAAVVGLLMWNPWWAIELGFVLSVSATAGLLLFSLPLSHRLAQWMPYWCALAIAVPLSAQLLCQPFIILLSPQMPTYGVLANIVAGPAASLATVFGLLTCVVALPAPWLGQVMMWIGWLPAQWIGSTAMSVSKFPFASLGWVPGVAGAFLAAFVSTCVLFSLLARSPRVRAIFATLLTVSLLFWLLILFVINFRSVSSIPTGWSIAVCDVGQGDAIVLASEGSYALIDTGREPELVDHCLMRLGISRLDLLVLTHFDKDHVGGLQAVIGKVDKAVVGQPENIEDESLLLDLSRSGAQLSRGISGLSGNLGAAKWQILWPDGLHPAMSVGNPGSVTLLVNFPEFQSLFLGDLGKESQLALMKTVSLPHIDVVKVAHHGSADQSMTLYQRIQPAVGLFSVGKGNEYGHPRKEILNELNSLNTLTPRTDEDGMILVIPNQTGISVWTEH